MDLVLKDANAPDRANAVFIYAKLVAGGMAPYLAKEAVESMWAAAFACGFRKRSAIQAAYETGFSA